MEDLNLETVKCEIVEDHIAIVKLDNPPVNAHSMQMLDDLTLTMDRLSDIDEVRAVILTGEGKVFCAGADIKGRAGAKPQKGAHWQSSRKAREAYHSIRECTKPVIGALNGAALGGGQAMAASCDILIASEKACLGLPEIDVGLLGGQRHAMRLFSHSRLRTMALTGQRIYGPELYRTGVVEECTTPEGLMDAAMKMARTLASKSPLAMTMAKASLNAIEEMSLRDGYRYEQNLTGQLSKSADSKEAMLAFAEKRAPVFTGK
ncbi:MAG: enoyl-CoA hydratase/isomerase family protein [Alphaproteobacteria bacterium]|nr:MAG: enoyl-CoA hydratase/isomerase family protein [Alphaproteobacteria bacterium]